MKVAVIGGGVNGLGCAIKIKEKFPSFDVKIITKNVTPNTTGDGSAGLWGPYLLGNTPPEKILQWSKHNHDLFLSLWRQGLAGSCMIPCIRVNKRKEGELPAWKDAVFGFTDLKNEALEKYKKILSLNIASAHHFVTFTCEPRLLLKYLMDRFINNGGQILIEEVKNVYDVCKMDYDIVINCTGLESRLIVPDNRVKPIRGQVTRVKTTWIFQAINNDTEEDGTYIIPNTTTCVLGGTHQENNFNTNVCKKDSEFIRNSCESLLPALKNVDTFYEWVGLRPGRDSVRVESEILKNEENSRKTILIHNYGHGGSGITLFWGCSEEVLNILIKCLNTSKL